MKQNRLLVLLITSAAACAPIATAYAQCACDFNNDGFRDGTDLAFINANFGNQNGVGDCTGDGFTDGADSTRLLSGWGACPTPTWATVLEWKVNAAIVTDSTLRSAIYAIDLPWRVLDTGTGIEMLLIPPGLFTMGCSPSDLYTGCPGDENPTHAVTLTNAFYLGRYEVTQEQWMTRVGSNPSHFVGYADSPSRPVEKVSWDMIANFNTMTGLRLPTEAKWEYAYRAQMGTEPLVTRTAFHNGNDDALLGNIAWYNVNSEIHTHAVGGKLANALGLHDMSGNVFEWVNDWYGSTYYSSSFSTNPTGPSSGEQRVVRGGGWFSWAHQCRASERFAHASNRGYYDRGFRSARNP